MKALQMLFACLGRLCIGSLFLLAGINHILDWNGSIHQLGDGLCRFASFSADNVALADFANMLTPWSTVLMGIATFCLLLGGLLVFFGIKTRFGAFLLILFVLGATFVFHAFWMFPPEEKSLQMTMFMQHIAILGGLLTLLALGNGTCKKPASKSKEE